MNKNGQTIIEVLVALSTAVVIISAATIAVMTALRNSQYTQVQNTATRYSQEGIEFMRYLRDSNYAMFSTISSNIPYCLNKGATTLYQATQPTTCEKATGGVTCGNNLDMYSRSIIITKNAPKCAPIPPPTPTPPATSSASMVTVIVSWTDSQCPNACPCHESKIISCLSDYTLAPIPVDPTPTP